MRKLLLTGFVFLVLISGCKLEFSTDSVSGTIGGVPFAFVSGFIHDSGHFEMYVSAEDYTTSFFEVDYPYLYGELSPIVTGEKELFPPVFDFVESYTLHGVVGPGEKVNFTQGIFEVTSVTATEVSGRLNIKTDIDSLNGVFTLTRVSWP